MTPDRFQVLRVFLALRDRSGNFADWNKLAALMSAVTSEERGRVATALLLNGKRHAWGLGEITDLVSRIGSERAIDVVRTAPTVDGNLRLRVMETLHLFDPASFPLGFSCEGAFARVRRSLPVAHPQAPPIAPTLFREVTPAPRRLQDAS